MQAQDVYFWAGDAAGAITRAVAQRARRSSARHLTACVCEIETAPLLAAMEALDASVLQGTTVHTTLARVDAAGSLDPGEVASSLSGEATVVVEVGNGDLGNLQPVAALAGLLGEDQLLIADARFSLGRIVQPTGWDLLVGEAHYFGGPPGISVVVSRSEPDPLGLGRGSGRSAGQDGSPPVWLAAGLALALEEHQQSLTQTLTRNQKALARLRQRVAAEIPDVWFPPRVEELGHIAAMSFLYVSAAELVDQLSERGWALASGSACTTDQRRPLHVLSAIGALTQGNLRVSLAPWTDAEIIDEFVEVLVPTIIGLRAQAGADAL